MSIRRKRKVTKRIIHKLHQEVETLAKVTFTNQPSPERLEMWRKACVDAVLRAAQQGKLDVKKTS